MVAQTNRFKCFVSLSICVFMVLSCVVNAQSPAAGDENHSLVNDSLRQALLGGSTYLEDDDGLHFIVDGGYRYSKVRGFLQTPAGGKVGSTSDKRPTFDEMGIDDYESTELNLKVGFGRHYIYGGASLSSMSNRFTLDNDLISRNVLFAAGSSVKADVEVNLYRIGYQYRFLFVNEGRPVFEIDPAVELTSFEFDYRLRSGASSVKRSYSKQTVRLGTDLKWYMTDKTTLTAGGMWSLPFSNTPEIMDLEFKIKHQLLGTRDKGLTGFLGIGYQLIDYKDDQDKPNHVRIESGPIYMAGLELAF